MVRANNDDGSFFFGDAVRLVSLAVAVIVCKASSISDDQWSSGQPDTGYGRLTRRSVDIDPVVVVRMEDRRLRKVVKLERRALGAV